MSYNFPYQINIHVCKTNRVMGCDPIDRVEKVWAYMDKDGEQVLMLPRHNLKPGVHHGNTPYVGRDSMIPVSEEEKEDRMYRHDQYIFSLMQDPEYWERPDYSEPDFDY